SGLSLGESRIPSLAVRESSLRCERKRRRNPPPAACFRSDRWHPQAPNLVSTKSLAPSSALDGPPQRSARTPSCLLHPAHCERSRRLVEKPQAASEESRRRLHSKEP